MTDRIFSHISSLLRHLERSEQRPSYSSSVLGLSSLSELVHATASARNVGRRLELGRRAASPACMMRNAEELYKMKLLKNCIMTQFQLLCVSRELENWTEDVSEPCREIVEAAELYNGRTADLFRETNSTQRRGWSKMQEKDQLSFADFVEMYVSSRSVHIAEQLLDSNCNADQVLNVARLDAIFVQSLVAICATHSSLLGELPEAPETPRQSSDTTGLTVQPQLGSGPSPLQQVLTTMELLVSSELWKEVSLCLKDGAQLRGYGGKKFAAIAESLPPEPGFVVVAKCLQYVANEVSIQQALTEWDIGFQKMLAAAQKPTCGNKSCKSVELLCSAVLPPIQNIMALSNTTSSAPNTPAVVADHVDCLRHYHCVSGPLRVSIQTIARALVGSLEMAVASQNLAAASHLLFEEAPHACNAIHPAMSRAWQVLPPTITFPAHSGFHLEQWRSQVSFSTLLHSRDRLSEELERICVCFHDFLMTRSRQCMQAVFPSVKYWKSINKRGTQHAPSQPSVYCDVIVEQLLLPIAEAALSLGELPQLSYMSLSASILLNEYRKAITINHHTYRPGAGRQLLVDLHHLSQWLTSEKLGLLSTTLQSLASLPIMAEMEQGLLLVCGATADDSQGSPLHSDGHSRPTASLFSSHVQGLSSLPVWTEIAWHSTTDWFKCMV